MTISTELSNLGEKLEVIGVFKKFSEHSFNLEIDVIDGYHLFKRSFK